MPGGLVCLRKDNAPRVSDFRQAVLAFPFHEHAAMAISLGDVLLGTIKTSAKEAMDLHCDGGGRTLPTPPRFEM